MNPSTIKLELELVVKVLVFVKLDPAPLNGTDAPSFEKMASKLFVPFIESVYVVDGLQGITALALAVLLDPFQAVPISVTDASNRFFPVLVVSTDVLPLIGQMLEYGANGMTAFVVHNIGVSEPL